MPKTTLPFDSGEYAPVSDRITMFRERHPTGRIITEMVERGEVVVFRALVYRAIDEPEPAATGWAAERIGDGEINQVACVENTETSAVGRALANLGFTASTRRPSREEMEKAQRERVRLARERQSGSRDPRLAIAGMRDGAAPAMVREDCATTKPTSAAAIDALELLAEAARAGLERSRVTRLRQRLEQDRNGIASVERLERALRRWLDARSAG